MGDPGFGDDLESGSILLLYFEGNSTGPSRVEKNPGAGAYLRK